MDQANNQLEQVQTHGINQENKTYSLEEPITNNDQKELGQISEIIVIQQQDHEQQEQEIWDNFVNNPPKQFQQQQQHQQQSYQKQQDQNISATVIEKTQESNNQIKKYDTKYKKEDNGRSRSRSLEKAFKLCCRRCKRNDKGGKTCICVVPAKQRRAQIGESGCQTCGCIGCSKEDFEMRGLVYDEEKHNKNRRRYSSNHEDDDEDSKPSSQIFEMRNGCCKKCLKAFSKTKKACLCQVPQKVRKTSLPPEGCKYCGCKGCNPEDTRGVIPERDKKRKKYNSSRHDKSESSESSDSREFSDMNLNNFDSSRLNIYPPLIGFGIPQRSYSYLYGKQENRK